MKIKQGEKYKCLVEIQHEEYTPIFKQGEVVEITGFRIGYKRHLYIKTNHGILLLNVFKLCFEPATTPSTK